MEKATSSSATDVGQSSTQTSPKSESQSATDAETFPVVLDDMGIEPIVKTTVALRGGRRSETSSTRMPRDGHGKKIGRQRRMSTGAVNKPLEDTEASESSGGPQAAFQDDSLGWEDWQEFVTSGDYVGTDVVADTNELLKLLDALEPYVPRMLFESSLYDHDTQLSKIPTIDSLFGAVMIADITGFTTLTERALTSKRGTELVEELLVAMNNYFTEAGEIVSMFGGDIIKVHGSSFIASVDKSPQ
ncbi:hypothetical protein MPTK1_3g24340 [Marchantia polymorpha subsp. ruderalis]|uniref:Guanylate cyclase domain-containing protein n=2 Tax=Marchantia polymorpha TaxID=3197 RepID=A0AAF6B4B2_MARPO|nr:hypothetical protein MARPO_0178s0021 [Marchantia polymorpha]BBN06846.1 hypothetical protein Mp_3g24340 [Marchantia polymorpha subsp. ruderalis]|eukprot:PTQ27971.1 hypothetical protein MARPO_0178s0021 [Marchantia polymorpha]